MAKLTKSYKCKKAKALVRFKHAANRRFFLKYGFRRAKMA